MVYYYRDVDVFAIRKEDFKAHFVTQPEYGPGKPEYHNPPLLFNISQDPGELYNIADKHPEVIAEMLRLKAEHEKTVTPVVNQLELKTK